jgi:hypothetical protein
VYVYPDVYLVFQYCKDTLVKREASHGFWFVRSSCNLPALERERGLVFSLQSAGGTGGERTTHVKSLKAMEGEREKTKDRGHSAIPISYR